MEKRKQHKKINVLEGLEKEEKKEKEIINLDKEIGIDEETEEMFQEEMESSQENESVLEEEVSENEEILEAQEEIVEENNETEKISEEDSTEEIEEEQEIPLEEDAEDLVVEEDTDSKPKKKIDGRWFLICILCVLLGIVFYAGFKVFNQYQSQEKVDEVAENKTENKDTTAPAFIGFLDRIVINLNAVDVDYSKYYLAVDNDQQMQVTVTGDVNLSQEGEYPITVSSTDEAGNTTSQDAIVQVISEETMVAVPIELTPMIDGSIPMATDTKQRVDANVIMYYYGEVSQEIKDEIARLGLDVSGYRLDSYWHPSDLNI